MIYFCNAGEIDPRLITTMGVNVKEGEAIGYFGTGLKYAIATLLRTGHTITIQSGKKHYVFTTLEETVRGKEFSFVCMNGQRLGFTTALGRNWTVENAYRELWSNARDEKGSVYPAPISTNGPMTVISVGGPDIDKVHEQRFDFLLDPKKQRLWVGPGLEIYLGRSRSIFYRGISVLNIPTHFTYNILNECTLTEDRTLSQWEACWNVERGLAECEDETILREMLCSEQPFEKKLDFFHEDFSPAFAGAVVSSIRDNPTKVNGSAVKAYYEGRVTQKVEFEPARLTGSEARCIVDTIDLLNRAGFAINSDDVHITKSCGDGVFAICINRQIYIAKECLERGILYQALIEEFLHLSTGFSDQTREFQNVLFHHIVRLVKERS